MVVAGMVGVIASDDFGAFRILQFSIHLLQSYFHVA
jgi:hypothetical protein